MIFKVIGKSFPNATRLACGILSALTLASCSGGGGSAPSTPNSTGTGNGASLKLKLVDASGAASGTVTTTSPLTAQATVLDASGAPVVNTLVNFAPSQPYVVVSPSSGAVLTNSSGVATATLSIASLAIAQTESGSADIITANATAGTTVLTAQAPFSLGSTAVTLSLVAPSPSTLNLAAYSSTLLKVNVLANGTAYTATPVVVNFSSACATSGKAVLPATATTVNGQAQVSYTDKGCSASDAVTIFAAGSAPITATLVDAAPTAASIEFVSATPAGDAIVIKGAGGNGRVETATLTFEALDTFGNPLPNETVNFSLNATQAVTLESTSAVTGANGQAVVTVSSGTLPTTFRVIATLPTGQTTLSDTISVTTGQPVQAAFSLSTTTFNIEGWGYDNTQTTLTALLADQSGNPVADGTPVIFETDSGAVGSSADGGCNTTNGGCSVTFRSQNPRFGLGNSAGKRAGLATISVSTTSAVYTLSGQIGVFLSGSFAVNIVQTPPGANPTVSNPSGILALPDCNMTFVKLQLNDLNFNPLPKGTTVAFAAGTQGGNSTAVIGSVFPAIVNDVVPHDASIAGNGTLIVGNMAPNQGSWHTFQFTPGGGAGSANACNPANPLGGGSGSLLVTITTPKGIATEYMVNFTYPM